MFAFPSYMIALIGEIAKTGVVVWLKYLVGWEWWPLGLRSSFDKENNTDWKNCNNWGAPHPLYSWTEGAHAVSDCLDICCLVLMIASILWSLKLTSKGFGPRVAPAIPSKLGSSPCVGGLMSKTCISEEKNNCSFISASLSPRHILCPEPKGMKWLGLCNLPSLRNLSGTNFLGSSHTSGSMCMAYSRGMTWVSFGMMCPSSSTVL